MSVHRHGHPGAEKAVLDGSKIGLKIETGEPRRGGDSWSPGNRQNTVGGGCDAGAQLGILSLGSRRKKRQVGRNKLRS